MAGKRKGRKPVRRKRMNKEKIDTEGAQAELCDALRSALLETERGLAHQWHEPQAAGDIYAAGGDCAASAWAKETAEKAAADAKERAGTLLMDCRREPMFPPLPLERLSYELEDLLTAFFIAEGRQIGQDTKSALDGRTPTTKSIREWAELKALELTRTIGTIAAEDLEIWERAHPKEAEAARRELTRFRREYKCSGIDIWKAAAVSRLTIGDD